MVGTSGRLGDEKGSPVQEVGDDFQKNDGVTIRRGAAEWLLSFDLDGFVFEMKMWENESTFEFLLTKK